MEILNRHYLQSWPDDSVYIGRGTVLGNPYVIGEHGDRDAVCDQYETWLSYKIEQGDPSVLTALYGIRETSALICSCSPERCHGSSIEAAWHRLQASMVQQATNNRTYAGIGSRSTPKHILARMTTVATRLAARGYTLRSGGADGADSAFEAGAGELKEIFLPWKGFNGNHSPFSGPTNEAFEVAKAVHPAWAKLSDAAKKLQARNSHQILGSNLRTRVDFVVCWTPDGCESEAGRTRDTGGTGQAIALANRWKIPVFNMANEDALERLGRLLLEYQ